MRLTRRDTLLGLAAMSFGRVSLALAAAATDRRLVVVVLRGALDGLAAVTPYGDANLATWRADLLPPAVGQPEGLLDLGGFYGLHPALTGLHQLYRQGELLVLHAVASDDRSRSHFEAQDTLELGALNHGITSGWLNRTAGLVRGQGAAEGALAVAGITPLLLRGPAKVATWTPATTSAPAPEFYAQLTALHAHDKLTGPALATALADRGFDATALAGMTAPANKNAFPGLCATAGRLLATPGGPRLGAFELTGWDTHARQAHLLPPSLKSLDAGLVALREAMGPVWAQTSVLVLTEFGRTVRANGTGGTDHGTATVAFVLGGAVAGGKVRATWPGLGAGQLFDNRDLAPTIDVRAVAKGLLADHLGLSPADLGAIFPGSVGVAPLRGLVRAA